MNFIYTPLEGMPDTLNKYGIDFVANEAIEVINLDSAKKLQNSPYMSACVEVVKEDKPKRKRRTSAEIEADNTSESDAA